MLPDSGDKMVMTCHILVMMLSHVSIAIPDLGHVSLSSHTKGQVTLASQDVHNKHLLTIDDSVVKRKTEKDKVNNMQYVGAVLNVNI